MQAVEPLLDCKALPSDVRVLSLSGREGINTMSRFDLEILTREHVDGDAAVGKEASLHLHDPAEGTTRTVGLVIAAMDHVAEDGDGERWAVTLAPNEHLLTMRRGYRIFLDKSMPEIVKELLSDAGIAGDRVIWRLAGTYAPRDQCVQYDETEWAFAERLLADEGVSYFFDLKDDKPVVVFADDAAAHDGIASPAEIPFDDSTSLLGARSFSALSLTDEVVTTAVHVRDFDVRHPDVFIEGKAGSGDAELFEYPACVLDASTAERRAKVRLEQLARFQRRAEAHGSCVRVQPGRLLDVFATADEATNRRWLVVSMEHRFTASAARHGHPEPYQHEVVMVPGGEKAFRPAAPTTRPRVEGMEVAVTTGPGGSEIHVDDLGQLKVRMPWDRSGIADDKSSTWARNMQTQLGGSMILPRVGWEVPVAYLDGNPDRPIVLGRLYNGESIVPYGLPGHAATSTFQSATSPGGGSTNELRMGDSGGSQEMFLHASKDQSVSVGGSAQTQVGANETHDVGLSLGVTIKGSQTLSVSGSQSVDVKTDYATTLGGSRTEMVGGLEMYKVTGNRIVDAKGAYTEVVGAVHGLQCNQSNTDVKGAFLQMVAGAIAHGCALGASESVAGARGEQVAGSKNIKAALGYSEKVIGIKSITAGASTVEAGGKVSTSSKSSSGTVNVGASADLSASGAFLITSKEITIEVSGSLDAGALQISGGTLKPTKGTAKLVGTIKRQGGSEIE